MGSAQKTLEKLVAHPALLFLQGPLFGPGVHSWHWIALAWEIGWCKQNESVLLSLFGAMILRLLFFFNSSSWALPELLLFLDSYPVVFRWGMKAGISYSLISLMPLSNFFSWLNTFFLWFIFPRNCIFLLQFVFILMIVNLCNIVHSSNYFTSCLMGGPLLVILRQQIIMGRKFYWGSVQGGLVMKLCFSLLSPYYMLHTRAISTL